jgi:rubrerythrin
MGTSNERPIARLLELIQLDADTIVRYQKALEHVDDFEARTDLETFMADHERHIGELTKIVFDLGGDVPPANLDLKGELRRVLTELRSATGTRGALRAMRSNERISNRAYERAIEHELPEAAVYAVTRNLADERRHLAAIEAHLERLGHADEADDTTAADAATRDLKVAPPPR